MESKRALGLQGERERCYRRRGGPSSPGGTRLLKALFGVEKDNIAFENCCFWNVPFREWMS
jgi:hypothetical protein